VHNHNCAVITDSRYGLAQLLWQVKGLALPIAGKILTTALD
jgi:hypothetical protein